MLLASPTRIPSNPSHTLIAPRCYIHPYIVFFLHPFNPQIPAATITWVRVFQFSVVWYRYTDGSTNCGISSIHKKGCHLRTQIYSFLGPWRPQKRVPGAWQQRQRQTRVLNPDKELGRLQQNIPRIGKLPYGAKWGFIERKALLKERLYWNNGFIERKG